MLPSDSEITGAFGDGLRQFFKLKGLGVNPSTLMAEKIWGVYDVTAGGYGSPVSFRQHNITIDHSAASVFVGLRDGLQGGSWTAATAADRYNRQSFLRLLGWSFDYDAGATTNPVYIQFRYWDGRASSDFGNIRVCALAPGQFSSAWQTVTASVSVARTADVNGFLIPPTHEAVFQIGNGGAGATASVLHLLTAEVALGGVVPPLR